jgi:NDP-4-keto-2,6-dideoxyhexose 3-C-methyltransferase
MFKQIDRCRICGNKNLISIINLGNQALTGVFPDQKNQTITIGPLELVKCSSKDDSEICGLIQLKHSFDHNEMYGDNYGYHSSLNKSMVKHLHSKVKKLQEIVPLAPGDIILDIGSNDSTLLKGYTKEGLSLVGIDPTGIKFKHYYPPHIKLIPDFFSAASFRAAFKDKKAKIITSISMYYDLERPMDFMKEIHEILDDNGVWVLEQSYMPTMLERSSYDTICHEHLEYYALKQIKWMADRVGFEIIDVEFNDVNGGSFSVMIGKKNSSYKVNTKGINDTLEAERNLKFDTDTPFELFRTKVDKSKKNLLDFLAKAKSENKTVMGYGASTKGNVILQYCGITEKDISCIAEINEDKFNKFTPGTGIPIVSEKEAKTKKPDYLLVLPWHFHDGIIERERTYIEGGGTLVFPLPELEIVNVHNYVYS